jgi:phosphoglycolate phosphatase
MITTVLFDLDGTLIHSAPGILAAFRKVLADAGIEPVDAVDERVIGPPLMKTLARLSGLEPGERLDAVATAFKATYDTVGVYHADPYPGCLEVLDRLVTAGRRSYIVTNKRRTPAVMIADLLGMQPRLAGLYTLDTLTPPAARKRDVVAHLLAEHRLTRETVVMVGDSGDDADAAAANDLGFIAATYGYGNPLADPAVRPAAVLDRLAALPDILARLD